MFDFQKLDVYKKAIAFHGEITALINCSNIDEVSQRQLQRASLSIPLNIAEGSGRLTKPDRRNFFIISRSSLFECVAILEILNNRHPEISLRYNDLLIQCDELSRMLYTMIKNLRKQD